MQTTPGHHPRHPLQVLLEMTHKDSPPHILEGALKKKAVFGLLPLWELSSRTLQPQIYVPESPQDTLLELPEFCLTSVVRGATCLCLTVTSLISIQGTAVMEMITEKLRK